MEHEDMRTLRWTLSRTRAALSAVSAMLAGEDNEGDWPEDVKREDLEASHELLCAQRDRLEARIAASAAKKLRKSSILDSSSRIRASFGKQKPCGDKS